MSRRAGRGVAAGLGKLTRQGSAPLRWALFEAAQSASHRGSPDYHDYHPVKARGLSHTRATLTIARKLARRSYHILRALGPAALNPCRPPLRSSPPITDALKACGQLQQRSRYPRPAWRPTKDRAAAVAPPKRPINHQVTGRQRSRPRAQISKGVHGATPHPHPASIRRPSMTGGRPPSHTHPHHHKHTTSGGLDTRAPAQISDRTVPPRRTRPCGRKRERRELAGGRRAGACGEAHFAVEMHLRRVTCSVVCSV